MSRSNQVGGPHHDLAMDFMKIIIFLAALINSYWIPNINEPKRLSDESVDCPECLPLCSKTTYRVLTSSIQYEPEQIASANWPLM